MLPSAIKKYCLI